MKKIERRAIRIKNFSIARDQPLVVICGPCVIESEDHSLKSAEFLKKTFASCQINLIFKSSYDKANRTAYHSFRGPGLEEGLRILEKVRRELDIPILTDIHTTEEATAAGQVCDVLQIPAFLCRQTDIVVAAAKTGRVVNIKKGQFMAPWNMGNLVDKAIEAGNENVILTDRGASFGYNNLVSDMRAIPIMQRFGVPVCFDATHSVQLPGGEGQSSGGQREFIPVLAKAALAAGADCLFLEAHPNPKEAKSDGASVIDFNELPRLLDHLNRLYQLMQQM